MTPESKPSAHTPGPWGLSITKDAFSSSKTGLPPWREGRSASIFSRHGDAPSGYKPITSTVGVVGRDWDEAEANARLIAAAPDLYAALEALLEGAHAAQCHMMSEYGKGEDAELTHLRITGGDRALSALKETARAALKEAGAQ